MPRDDEEAGIPYGLPIATDDRSAFVPKHPRGRDQFEEPEAVPCPTRSGTLTDEDHVELERQKEAESKRVAEKELQSQMRNLSVFASAVQMFFTSLLLIMIVVCCLFIFSQTVQVLAALNALPKLLRYGGYGALVVVGGVTLFYIVRLMLAVMRLRRNRQLSLTQMRAFESRRELQELARTDRGNAKAELEKWLKTYPLDDPGHARFLAACGQEAQLQHLAAVRSELLNPPKQKPWDQWIEQFTRQWQSTLDNAAERIIRDYAEIVAVKTAISPNPLIDTCAVIYNGFGMLGSLCYVYNLRPGPLALVQFAGLVFTQGYLSGRLEDLPVDNWLANAVNGALKNAKQINLPVVGNIVGALAGPAIQGTANGWIIYRLGLQARALLRPVAID